MNEHEPAPERDELRVLALAATSRDGEVTCRLLGLAGIGCLICSSLSALADEIGKGAGAILLTDAALLAPGMPAVIDALDRQPAWSDVPALVFAHERGRSVAVKKALATLRNVTLLDMPSSAQAMVSAVQSALRGRQRQFQIRDQLQAQRNAELALRDADRKKDEFLATLAHELRNPLAAISTAIALMSRSPAGDATRDASTLGLMDRQSKLLVKLIDELLDVSRIATGKVVLVYERVDLAAVIAGALETSRIALDAAGHRTTIDVSAQSLVVMGDPARLSQVIGNLLRNAAKYTPPGGHVSVVAGRDGEQVYVRVEDSGLGIPLDMQQKVFDMFTQINKTLDRAQGGLGIGLSLVKRLVELHGGSVACFSEGAGKGSAFTVRLPAAETWESSTPADGPAPGTAVARRVLVVDDNADVADVFASLLKLEGHEVRVAYSGAEALTMYSAFQPQIVFCDLGLPGMSGYEVAKRIRQEPYMQPALLVAVTGWGGAEDRRRTREAGFDHHLTKPVNLDEIGQLLLQA